MTEFFMLDQNGKGVLDKVSRKTTFLQPSEESIDDDYEIDLVESDEQPKTPLIKTTEKGSAPNEKRPNKSISPKLKLKLNHEKKKYKFDFELNEPNLFDEDDDEDEVTEMTHFKQPLNTPPPITIGKIKIFDPGRRRRAMRFKRFLKRCFAIIFLVISLLILFQNFDHMSEIMRAALGWIDKSLYQVSQSKSNTRCEQVVSTAVWRQNFPMLTIESALRLMDVNNDTMLDLVVPFGTGIDAAYYDRTLCQIYFNQTEMESTSIGCGGGVMALDGKNGEPLWAQYTAHELFAANCNADLNLDGQKDCIIGGRMASLYAINGKTGNILWSITSNYGEPISETSNFYTPLLIPKDVDGDSVADIVVMHGGDPLRKPGEKIKNVARLMVISAKTGQILNWNYVPDNAESYYSPQLLVHPDGTLLVLFGTGGETHPGGLYVVALEALLNGKLQHSWRAIFQDCCKGVITPPVLVDINGDEVVDIVMAHFNSTVFAFDGLTFELIWRREFIGSETYSSPSVGYFNDDNIPDFAVTYQFGPGFPIYYYAEFHILDGRNGQLLLKQPVRMPIGTQSSPLTVSTLARNDIFLYWYSSCTNGTSVNETQELTDNKPFEILPGTTIHESSRADFCGLRFGEGAKQYTQYRAITPNFTVPIYDSRADEPTVERINFTDIAYKWYQEKLTLVTGTNVLQNDNSNTAQFNNVIKQNNVYNPGELWGSDQQDLYNINPSKRDSSADSSLYDSNVYQVLKKYKKWPIQQNATKPENVIQFEPHFYSYGSAQYSQRSKRNTQSLESRTKRHVGLHNGDQVQRVISTGTLAPSLTGINSRASSMADKLPVDDSIDIVFATYSFPPSSVKRMSDTVRQCVQEYLKPEKEAEMRLLNENSVFKRLGYDHDAYEATVKELCAKQDGDAPTDSPDPSKVEQDQLKANGLLREMGSMTVHRINLKCFDSKKNKQVEIKEYRYQWWPSYLGIFADSVANLVDP